jgi:DNA-binding MarR family transcriptional regulator
MGLLSKLFELRESLDAYERELGFGQLSEVEKAVLEFVIHQKDATITSVTKNKYFSKYSLSTIKRAVGILLDDGIINANQSKSDRRSMILTYNN